MLMWEIIAGLLIWAIIVIWMIALTNANGKDDGE